MADVGCVTEVDLRALLVGDLPEPIAEAIACHLENCPACEAAARQLDSATDPFLRCMRQAVHPAASGTSTLESLSDGITASQAEPPIDDQGAAESKWPAGYTILEELGRGGMSVVYKARQRRPERVVALKVLLSGGHASTERRLRFVAEANAIARLQHPNIVQVYEVGEHDGLPFLVLEFMDGGNLAQKLAGRPLPARPAALLCEVLARAVEHAHSHGVVHRDLKPANVLLQQEQGRQDKETRGQVDKERRSLDSPALTDSAVFQSPSLPVSLSAFRPKISDFGLAKQERPDLTATGEVLGTPSYMAPEQAHGAGRQVGPLADVYALGAMLYEFLTGRPPFLGASALQTLEQVRSQEPVPPSRLRPDVPRDLETICLKCLQKEQDKRYAGALALAEDLRRFSSGEPILARPVTNWERGWRWSRRNPLLAAVSATAILLLVTAAVAVIAGIVNAQRAKVRIQQAFEAESIASQRARQSLDAMFSQVVQDWLASRSKLEPAQKEFLEKALGYYQAFAAESGDRQDIRDGVANALRRSGQIRELMGQHEEALTAYAKAQDQYHALCRNYPLVSDYRSALAESYRSRGELLQRMGRFPDAEEAQRASIAVLQQQAADFPEGPDLEQLARTQASLGTLLRVTGQLSAAEATLGEALATQKQLVATDPARAAYRMELATTYNDLAILLDLTRRPEKAEQAYRDSIAAIKPLTIDFPTVARYRFDLAIRHYNMGKLFLTINTKVAEAALRDALTLQKELVADFPSVPVYRSGLANSHHNLALIFSRTGRLKEAEAAYRDAVAERRQLAADYPSMPSYQEDAGSDINGLGLFLMDHGRPTEAESAFREGLALRQELSRRYPANTAYLGMVTQSQAMLAVLWAGNGDQARAVVQAEEVQSSPHITGVACYDLACAYSLASAAVNKDIKLSAEKRSKLVEDYAGRAVALLAKAIAKGYPDIADMKTDRDLNPIRKRPEFQKLLQEWEKSTSRKPG
jgi:serine/threonine-protein kinase